MLNYFCLFSTYFCFPQLNFLPSPLQTFTTAATTIIIAVVVIFACILLSSAAYFCENLYTIFQIDLKAFLHHLQEAMFLRTRLKHIEKHVSQQRHQLQNQNQLERSSLDEEPFLSVPPPPPPTLSARPTILSPRAKSGGGSSSGVRRSF